MPLEKSKNIILSYQGELDFETIGNLIGRLQQIMKEEGERVNVYKKILTVMIESLENVYKYCSDFDLSDIPENKHTQFSLSHNDEYYIMQIANPVLNKDVKKIKNHLDCINELDYYGLKKLYKNTITDGKFSAKGGAGLGFIEMAKLACDKLNYEFTDLNDQFKYFKLIICIS
ncbi:MAG: hypothetical protein GVY19_04840 [Bacteroidetes bacterium]|jgi:hypothetical protein|nr:hypothetical protein [Bacteroidota bacterium]